VSYKGGRWHGERWKKVVLQRTKVALSTRHRLQYFWLLIHPLRAEDEAVLAVLKGKQHSAESQREKWCLLSIHYLKGKDEVLLTVRKGRKPLAESG
jgi:hypothetical protein